METKLTKTLPHLDPERMAKARNAVRTNYVPKDLKPPFFFDDLLGLDNAHKRVALIHPDGTIAHQFTDARWKDPQGLCGSSHGTPRIYVSDGHSVYSYDKQGVPQETLVTGLPSVGALSTRSGKIYVANPVENKVLCYDTLGHQIATYDNWGGKDYQQITDIQATQQGLYVSFKGHYSPTNPDTWIPGGVVSVYKAGDAGTPLALPLDEQQHQPDGITAMAFTSYELHPTGTIYLTVVNTFGYVSVFDSRNGSPWSLVRSSYTSVSTQSLVVSDEPELPHTLLGAGGGIGVWTTYGGGLIAPLTWDYESNWTDLAFFNQ